MTLLVSLTLLVVGVVVLLAGLLGHRVGLSAPHGRRVAWASLVFFVLGLVFPFAFPTYKVWEQNKAGEAELARAEQNRQIAVQEAKAKEESARSLANAEVIRAEGVAKANKIIGDSLRDNDVYIHYLWIEALKESDSDVIYVPTEAGIPITEASRLLKKGHDGEDGGK